MLARIQFLALLLLLAIPRLDAQDLASRGPLPKVTIPTARSYQPAASTRSRTSARTTPRSLYPWKLGITATVFWIGELPTQNNPTPNTASSWDQDWDDNFGGYDDPNPSARIADPRTGDYRPKAFIPKLNPFYIALPYNDRLTHNRHKPEAARVIPWFKQVKPKPGQTVLRGRWVQIHRNGRDCYAQWEDCGPWITNDWQYVFGSAKPRNRNNNSAGIDISPAIRDYLGVKSGQQVHWRFVEANQVPYGPWKRYGNNHSNTSNPDIDAQRRYLDYLRTLRDAKYQRKSVQELQH
jgi:hypothetical protein